MKKLADILNAALLPEIGEQLQDNAGRIWTAAADSRGSMYLHAPGNRTERHPGTPITSHWVDIIRIANKERQEITR
jgi:hypothetical protein